MIRPPESSFSPAPRGAPAPDRLARFAFARALGAGAREELAAATRFVRCDEATAIGSPGAALEGVPFVERGRIAVRQTTAAGREIVLYDVEPGDGCVLALGAALRARPYPAEAIAAPGTELAVVDARTLRAIAAREPAVQDVALSLFAARFEQLATLVHEVAFERMDTRLARLLLRESRVGGGVMRPVELGHAQLAARLGTAREVVTRSLDVMRQHGHVAIERGRVHVLDPAALAGEHGIVLESDAGHGTGGDRG